MRIAIAFLATLIFSPAWAETAVIGNPSNSDSLSASDVSRIFLGKSKKFPSGAKATPINLPDGDPTRDSFNSTVLKKDAGQLKAYWSKLIFTGKAKPPKNASSSADAKAKVAADANAISYIPADQVDGSVKVLLTF